MEVLVFRVLVFGPEISICISLSLLVTDYAQNLPVFSCDIFVYVDNPPAKVFRKRL